MLPEDCKSMQILNLVLALDSVVVETHKICSRKKLMEGDFGSGQSARNFVFVFGVLAEVIHPVGATSLPSLSPSVSSNDSPPSNGRPNGTILPMLLVNP